ncbi:glycosyltransferase [bacterium]|nr:glycosyltransferase [bacterium]
MEKLVIISHTPHFMKDNQIVGWAATVREIDALSHLFDQVIHVAPLHVNEKPHASVAPYESPKVQLKPVRPSGGNTIGAKFRSLFSIPEYLKAIRSEVRDAKVVHVRCPANISLLAIIFLAFIREPRIRWFKYAGNWKPEDGESLSYRIQRWFLRRGIHRGVVTVNGNWPGEPEFVHAFPNPCLTTEELVRAKTIVSQKRISDPIRIVFAGRLEEEKGVGRCLEILSRLKKRNVNAILDLVGDGPAAESFQNLAESLGVSDATKFHGWIPRAQLASIYSTGHIFLFPSSCSEGWPKVLSEAMGYGVVPIASNISSIPYHLQQFRCGMFFKPDDLEGFVSAIISYQENPELWCDHSFNGSQAAEFFTYENYLTKVSSLLKLNHQEAIVLPRTV